MSPKKGRFPTGKTSSKFFQPLIFRGHVSFRGSNSILVDGIVSFPLFVDRNLSLLGQL